jgi:hypothetical protein
MVSVMDLLQSLSLSAEACMMRRKEAAHGRIQIIYHYQHVARGARDQYVAHKGDGVVGGRDA